MPFNQYHEPVEELLGETRTAETVNWYEQRISVEADDNARQVMAHSQKEEFIHFGMNLEFLSFTKKPGMASCIEEHPLQGR